MEDDLSYAQPQGDEECACGNCDAVLLLPAEDAQAIATTPQKQRGGANLPVGTRVVNAVNFCR